MLPMGPQPALPTDEACKGTQNWPHAPPHRLRSAGVYFLTARTSERRHLLAEDALKDWFQVTLFQLIHEAGWRLEAWCILSNHYHLVVHSPEEGGSSLKVVIQRLHSFTTKELNRRDGTPGRTRLWQNFRETLLDQQASYMARLHYVHQNAVHHGLVKTGSDWKWCSALAFKKAVTPAWMRTVASFKYDRIAELDGEGREGGV
jgi:putative transposase